MSTLIISMISVTLALGALGKIMQSCKNQYFPWAYILCGITGLVTIGWAITEHQGNIEVPYRDLEITETWIGHFPELSQELVDALEDEKFTRSEHQNLERRYNVLLMKWNLAQLKIKAQKNVKQE